MSNETAPFLPYGRQLIEEDDIAAVVEVLRSDFLTTGPKVMEFETEFAERVGARHAVACSSGTAALHLATMAAGLGAGDGAIVPAITFLATANAVRYAGADVVFADVDPDTGLMTPDTFEAALDDGKRRSIRMVLPVHLNGQACDMVEIQHRAQKHDLTIIEDACHMLGGAVSGGHAVGACQYGDMNIFSAHPVKAIAMGEGGVVTTNHKTTAAHLKRLSNHGMERAPERLVNHKQALAADGTPNPWYYEMSEIGFNYRASDIHCALGLSQLAKLDRFVSRRNTLVEYYAARLQPLDPIVKPVARSSHGKAAWHVAVILIDFEAVGMDRATVMNSLRERGIGSQVLYTPLYRQPYYENLYGEHHMAGAEAYYARCLCLPLFVDMTESDVDRVIESLAETLGLKAE
ncbi:MAG: UDP-4-amino-4,6-dideoxy-N-acetyl-beta-L-altrosamine transaminase [Proteobacteria bacterium]|nr:UDP-4-amino-4,6-dideoxy-N-acetyl-beta-L-altrosamine transaminase [Pseudomonadota bacterium]